MKIVITQPTRHDGKRYQPGDSLDIERAAGTALVKAHAAQEADPEATAKAKADADAKAKADQSAP